MAMRVTKKGVVGAEADPWLRLDTDQPRRPELLEAARAITPN